MRKVELLYATRSRFKRNEVKQLEESTIVKGRSGASTAVAEQVRVVFTDVETDEPLERNLSETVKHKSISAYRKLLQPCIVEHAGLILKEYQEADYPGGLTQPMWDALGAEKFLQSIGWASGGVTARAVVGYCD